MFLTLLYHHFQRKNLFINFKEDMQFLEKHYHFILPGEKVPLNPLSLCLTFDDAYFDFYYYVYPLLKELNIRAVLAVPVKFIQEKSSLSIKERLAMPYSNAAPSDAFCSWEELQEMANSKQVMLASHSYSHAKLADAISQKVEAINSEREQGFLDFARSPWLKSMDDEQNTKSHSSQLEVIPQVFEKLLSDPSVNLEEEIVLSKKLLEKRIGKEITSFVYPFGNFNHRVHKMVKEHYKYVFRIGNALNFSWQNLSGLNYRIVCDGKRAAEFLNPFCYAAYSGSFLLNSIRGR